MFRNITNQKVVDFLDGFYSPASEALSQLRNEAEENKVPIFSKDSESLILNLLRISKPKTLLEIGTAVGYSACCMAEAVKDLNIVTVEKSDNMYNTALKNIEKLGFSDRITALNGDAAEVVNSLSKEEYSFDVVFIDAAKSHYKDFFDAALPYCHSGTIIICDNMLFKARVVSDEYDPDRRHKTNIRKLREFADYLFSLDSMNSTFLSVGDGLTISVIK